MTVKIFVSCIFLIPLYGHSQKLPNPKIGKSEIEIGIFNYLDNKRYWRYGDARDALGAEAVYRFAWRNCTKIGGGFLIAADYSGDYSFENRVFPYGAVFADVAQFIGEKQKWNASGRIGHGLYKREYVTETTNSKTVNKFTGGMYYYLSIRYRVVVSKTILLNISPFYGIRNFRRSFLYETYSPASIERDQGKEFHDGIGLGIGIIF